MPKYLVVVYMFTAFLNSALAVCTLDEIGCCLTEYSSLIQPSGIRLSEQRVSAVCTFEDETLECLDLFMDQCSRNETDVKEVEDLINRTKAYISQICPPSSDFMARPYRVPSMYSAEFWPNTRTVPRSWLKENEMCIMNASENFQTCYNKTVLPSPDDSDEERTKKECCEYKELRNCVVQAVEDKCGATPSQLVHEEVVHINGAVLEWSCSEIFSKCENTAGMLASSAIIVLWSVIFCKYCLY